jgi:type IV secretion system protein VirB3
MFMGVPYIPFFIGSGVPLMLAMYFNFFWLLGIPLSIMVMRQMARRDEMIFRLIGLRLQFKMKVRNLKHHAGLWVFSPNLYRDK